MTPPAVMLRTLAAIAAVLPAATAFAGDFATLNPIGFSSDGDVFAFEQYGIQDGSGFPYADIFFLDLDEDRFLAPSPVHVRLETDGASVEAARREARRKAAALFEAHDPEENRGLVVLHNPPTEVSADPHRGRFLPRAFEPTPDEPIELAIETIPLAAPNGCGGFGPILGYRLIETREGNEPVVLHEDESIPESRGCPLDYRLSQVVVHGETSGGMRAVAIIGIKSVGFEGPNLRFIANPVPLG